MKNIALLIMAAALFAGCSDQDNDGPSAETSVKIDTGNAGEKIEEGFKKAGRELEQGAEKVKEGLQDAGNKIEEKYEETKDKLTDDKKAEVEVKIDKD